MFGINYTMPSTRDVGMLVVAPVAVGGQFFVLEVY